MSGFRKFTLELCNYMFIESFAFVFSFLLSALVLVVMVELYSALVYLHCHNGNTLDFKQPDIDNFKIIIPAHNEQDIILNNLVALFDHIRDPRSIIVIADNCTDHTAEIARGQGVTVVERHEPSRQGKGYALDFGLNFLKKNPPKVVIFLDADCCIHSGSLSHLANVSLQSNRPVQSKYIMEVRGNDSGRKRIAALAFIFKNYIRPLGLKQLGFPCLLTGTGIALPWKIAMETQFATGNIVEDMQIGLDLINDGKETLFYEKLTVISQFPDEKKALNNQRTRWEHGHLSTIITQVPRLLATAFRRKKPGLLFIALDLAVPPLSLLTLILLMNFAIAAISVLLLGLNKLILAISCLPLFLFVVTIFLGWNRFAKQVITFRQLLMIPLYVVSKIPVYFNYCLSPEKRWIKTDRN